MLKKKLISMVESKKIKNSSVLWKFIDEETSKLIDCAFGKNKTEKLYNWLYGPNRTCDSCASDLVTFKNFIHGYHRFCSAFCAGEWFRRNESDVERKERNAKISASHRAKSTEEIKEIEKKTKITKFLKYGDENFNNPTKNKETMFKKYGVEHALQFDDFNQKFKNTLKNKDWTKSVELRKHTFLKKYNVDHQLKVPEIIAKIKETNLIKYGVENPIQCPSINEKRVKTSYHRKEFILPSGNIIHLQGYECHTLKKLLKKFDEEEIITKQSNMPTIWYALDGKTHRYFPDFFIPKENRIIEVKSDHTMKLHLRKNIAKRNRCIELGYLFEFEIYDKNLNILDQNDFLI